MSDLEGLGMVDLTHMRSRFGMFGDSEVRGVQWQQPNGKVVWHISISPTWNRIRDFWVEGGTVSRMQGIFTGSYRVFHPVQEAPDIEAEERRVILEAIANWGGA